jgi:hypothetical protein
MSLTRVTHYKLEFRPQRRLGQITLVLQGGSEVVLKDLLAETFHAVSVMLREERPIFFDSAEGAILTGSEPVGEDEID